MFIYYHDPDQYHPDYIEEVLARLSEEKDLLYESAIKDHFLIKPVLKDKLYCLNDADLKYVLAVLSKYDYIPNEDPAILAKQIKEENFIEYKRTTPWYFSDIDVLDSAGDHISYGYCKANFHFVNTWGHTSEHFLHRIIYDKATMVVCWADLGTYTDNFDEIKNIIKNAEEGEFFVSFGNQVFRITYISRSVCFERSHDTSQTKLESIENNSFDAYVINNICKESEDGCIYGNVSEYEFMQFAEVTDCVSKNFFKKGPQWKYGDSCEMNEGITPTNIKGIYADNGIFKICIENNTFAIPQTAIICLDIENLEISSEKTKRKVRMEDFCIL